MARKKETRRSIRRVAVEPRRKFSSGRFGQWIFLTGVIIAIVAGALNTVQTQVLWILALLGTIVGLINMSLKDEVPFLIAVLVLLTSSSSVGLLLSGVPQVGMQLVTVLTHLVVFVVPAGFLVALKLIYSFAKA